MPEPYLPAVTVPASATHPVVLDPGDANYLLDVLWQQLAGIEPSPERVAHALGILVWTVEDQPEPCAECIAAAPDQPAEPTRFALYRLLDTNGRVLYVGVSRNVEARLRVHRRNWGRLWDDVLVEHYPDAEAMLEAEAMAIAAEQPPLNSAGLVP